MTVTIFNMKSFPDLPPLINSNELNHLKLGCRPLSVFMKLLQISVTVSIFYYLILKSMYLKSYT